jgi:prevent-host-death family protein
LTNSKERPRVEDMVKSVRAGAINLYEAKTNLSALVDRAAAGEEITIAKAGKPLARLVPLATRCRRPRPGVLAGKVRIAPDFDAPLSPEALLGDG